MSYQLTVTEKRGYLHCVVTGKNTMEVVAGYQFVSKGSARNLGKFRAVAYVDVNAEGELMKFAETVASDRGLPMTVFATVPEAENRLLGKGG